MSPFQFGGMLIAGILIFGGLGFLVDQWLHTRALWLIIGVLYAIISSFIILIYRSTREKKQ